MNYGSSAKEYSARIKELLAHGREASLLYAALELRCGVEARIKEYLDPLEHLPKSIKKEYSVVKLGRAVDEAFQGKDKVALITLFLPGSDKAVTLKYIPVPKRLEDIAAKAGDALHFPGEARLEDPSWWERLRGMLQEGSAWYAWVASGDLLGMPLMNRKNQTSMRVAMAADDPRTGTLRSLTEGEDHLLRVAYEPVPQSPPDA